MKHLHLPVDHLLVLTGVMLGLMAHEIVLWLARRKDPFHLWATGWAGATATFVLGHYIQRAAGTPEAAIDGTLLGLSSAVALAPLSIGTVRAVSLEAMPRVALVLSAAGAAVLIGFIQFSGWAVRRVHMRTDAFGITYWDNDATVLHDIGLAFIVAWSIFIVRRIHRTRPRDPSPRHKAAQRLGWFMLPLVINDILHGAEIINSVELVGYGFCVVAIGMSYAMTQRHERSAQGARALIQASPDAILVHRARRLLYVNPAAQTLLGYGTERLEGRPVGVLMPEAERSELELRYDATELSSMATSPVAETFMRKDGTSIRGEVVRVGFSFDGQPAGATIVRDISEREEVQRQLRLADRMVSVGTLAAGAAHEINNPLTYVVMNIEAALHRISAPDGAAFSEVTEALEEARDGARRIAQVVRDIAIFSRPDEETIEVVDVCAVLDSALGLTAHEIRHRARLTRDYQGECSVSANASRLGQVFVNLLVNAAQAIQEGNAEQNEVLVATRQQADRVVIEVIDTGIGLPKDGMERLFDPFYTTKPVGQGTGLGLSICHGIVNALGGSIELRPRARRGTVARVVLTSACEADAASMPIVRPSKPSIPPCGRILVVDDEPVVARSLKRLLIGHDVTVVTSGQEALEHFSPDKFDVIICDLMMPRMTGMEVYEQLHASFPGIEERVVFMTGGVFTSAAHQFLQTVPTSLIEKPFDSAAVRKTLSMVLRRVRPDNVGTAVSS